MATVVSPKHKSAARRLTDIVTLASSPRQSSPGGSADG
jgi:hypothetical protein